MILICQTRILGQVAGKKTEKFVLLHCQVVSKKLDVNLHLTVL